MQNKGSFVVSLNCLGTIWDFFHIFGTVGSINFRASQSETVIIIIMDPDPSVKKKKLINLDFYSFVAFQ